MSRWRETSRVAEVVGIGWALGLALYTSLYFALFQAGLPDRMAMVVALFVAVLSAAAIGQRVWRAPRSARVAGVSARMAAGCGLIVAAAQVVFSAWIAWRAPLASWDAWSFWSFKARMFLLGGPRHGYFHDAVTLHTHPDYPLNLPLAEAALFHLPGPLGLHMAALLGPVCLAALLLLFYGGMTRLYGAGIAALAVAALAVVPALARQAAGGDADVPLAMYLGAASLYLLLWWREHRLLDAVLMALLVGSACWTKKEGLGVAAVLLAAFAVGVVRERAARRGARLRHALAVLATALVIPLPWFVFVRVTHPLARDFLPLTPAVFVAHVDRLPHIALFFALQMLYFANWSVLWLLLAAIVLLAARRLSWSGRALLVVFVAQLAVYMLAFVFSNWQPYTDHLRTSVGRLLVQATPLAVLLLTECVWSMSTVTAQRASSTQAEQRDVSATLPVRHP